MRRDQQYGMLPRDLFLSFLHRLREPTALSLLTSLLAKMQSILKEDSTGEISTEYQHLWPSAVGSPGTSVSAVEESLKSVLAHSLRVCPSRPAWLRTQADVCLAEGAYATAMRFYLEAGLVATDFFTCPVPKQVYDDMVYRRMIRCCQQMQCHTQVRKIKSK